MSNGIYKLRVPVKYMVPDAKKEDVEILKFLQKTVSDAIEKGEGVIVLPAVRDGDGNLLFDIEYVGPNQIK